MEAADGFPSSLLEGNKKPRSRSAPVARDLSQLEIEKIIDTDALTVQI